MSLPERPIPSLPRDTARIGAQVLAPTDPYRIIGDQLSALLDDAPYADLYAATGRHALSPARLALIVIFQFLEDLPDREAARQVAVRLDWKYALHLSLTAPRFDFSVLSYFRKRLRDGGREAQQFEAVLAQVRAHGLLRKRGVQRTDSTHVLAAVERLSELELVSETLRLALVALDAAQPVWIAAAVPAAFRDTYAERRTGYRLTPDERTQQFRLVGEDGRWLLALLEGATVPEGLADLPAVATLRTVWAQRFQDDPEGRPAPRPITETPGGERIMTPHDPEARLGSKRGEHWVGEKVHVTETEGPDGTRFLTDVETANAAEHDIRALARIRDRERFGDRLPSEQDVDSAYVSGQELARSAAAGIDLVGPPPQDTTANGLGRDQFTIDTEAQTVTCPEGKVATNWRTGTARDGSASTHVRFRTADCAGCPRKATCCPEAQSGRSLTWTEHTPRLEARRAEASTPAFRRKQHRRSGIEATIAELVGRYRLRRHRYRGEARRRQENQMKGAACNLARLARALSTPPPPDPVQPVALRAA